MIKFWEYMNELINCRQYNKGGEISDNGKRWTNPDNRKADTKLKERKYMKTEALIEGGSTI